MDVQVDKAAIARDLVEALRACIKKDHYGRLSTGVVRISEFKRTNIERWVDRKLLPPPIQMNNAQMWDHLKGHLPKAVVADIEEAVDEAIEQLEHQGCVRRGGEIDNVRYPSDDWLTLTRKGVRELSSSKNPLEVHTNDANLFDQRAFHPEVVRVSRKLFANGHYTQAVFEACKALSFVVRSKSGLTSDGASLMTRAFSPNNPILKLNLLSNQSDRDEQQGFMLLFQGAMLAIRNPAAHEIVSIRDPHEALEYLSFLSLLFRKLDEAQT